MDAHSSHPTLPRRGRPRRARGFTLIEVLIVVVIVAILAAVALPSYRRSVLKSHRADAMATLTQAQATMERCYAQNFSYSAACAGYATAQATPGGYYNVALAVVAGPPATYTFTATATGSQTADTQCASMSIDQAGTKVGKDSAGAVQTACWNP